MKKYIAINFFIVLLLFTITGCLNNNYLIKIDNEKVSKGEFLIYLNEAKINFEALGGSDIWETDFEGLSAEEVAKNSAINAVELVKISKNKALELDISLTDDEIKKANNDADIKYNLLKDLNINNEISLKDVRTVMYDQMLYNKIYNSLTSSFEISQVDFESYYNSVYLNIYNDYKEYTVKGIYFDDYLKANEFVQKFREYGNFDELFEEYKRSSDIENKYRVLYKKDLETFFGLTFDTNIGEITSVLDTGDGYYVLKVENIENPTEDKIENIAKQIYTNNKRQQFFNEEYEKWSKDVEIEKNEELLYDIQINYLS